MFTEIPILYEDEFLLVLNKPSGFHSVIVPGSENPSVAQLLIDYDSKFRSASLKAEDGGLLHRLDHETSGVLLVAKDRKSWELFYEVLRGGPSQKSYRIIVEGIAPEVSEVAGYIGSPHRGARKVRVYTSRPEKRARALPAQSRFEKEGSDPKRSISILRATAHQARRHQIRAHAASIGHALVGDTLYGSTKNLSEVLGVSAPPFALHAERVSLISPLTKKKIVFEAALPDYFIPSDAEWT